MLQMVGTVIVFFGAFDLLNENFDIKKVLTKIVVGTVVIGVGIIMKKYGDGD